MAESILDKILAVKRREVREAIERLMKAGQKIGSRDSAGRSLTAALRREAGQPVRVLAEIKRASPSAGPIRAGADPVAIARDYEAAGAAAISVLTDRTFFDGDVGFLAPVAAATNVPILRKDFICHHFQIAEASANNADAVLLIVAMLRHDELSQMIHDAHRKHMEALVEAHSLGEAEDALAAGARVLGVNHRDLRTFAIDMTLTEQIAKRVPSDVVLVAESGIRSRDDVRRMGDAGAHAVLVGEHLMRAPSPGAALRKLLGSS